MPRKKVMIEKVTMTEEATAMTNMKDTIRTGVTATTLLTDIKVIRLMDIKATHHMDIRTIHPTDIEAMDTLHTDIETMDTALLMDTRLKGFGYRDAPKGFGYRLSTNMFADIAAQ